MREERTYKRIFTAVIITLFVLCGLYIWLWLNPSLYLIRGYREFFTGNDFFMSFIDFPGQPTEYLSRLFTQFYNFPAVAALLIILCLSSIYILSFYMLRNERPVFFIPLLPVLILLFMHNDYGHSIRFDLNLMFLGISLLLFKFLIKQSKQVFLYSGYTLILMILLYMTGIITAITFVTAALLISGLKDKIRHLPGLTAGTLIVFVLFHFMFSFSFHDLRQEFVDITRIYSFSYYPLLLFASVAILPLLKDLIPVNAENFPRKIVAGFIVFIVPAVLLMLFFTLDREERLSLRVQHHARNGNWEMTLDAARGCEYPDKNMVYCTNLALYNTGKIYNELFSFNQGFGSEGLMLAEMGVFSEIVPNQDIFMQLGALSLSIIWGTEATNVYGTNPYVLRNLTKAYLAGGYIREAQKTLNLLEQTLFQKEWVDKYRAIANDTALIRSDEELNRLRESQTPLAVISKQSPLTNLFLLSQDSSLNKMAYDYLVIGTLLDHQIENFSYCISRLKEYGYEKIPKVYMEGLVYSMLYSPTLPINTRDFGYDESIVLRFYAFQSELLMLQNNMNNAKKVLKNKFGDTYWYYLLFESPLNDGERMKIFKKLVS